MQLRRIIALLATFAAALLAGATITTASAAAEGVTVAGPSGGELAARGTLFYNIRAAHTNKCLDISGVSQETGARAHQWDCLGFGQLNQQFTLRDAGGGAVYIVALHSGKCLDISGVSQDDGADVWQWDCIAGQPNQRWSIDYSGGGLYTIRALHSGKCLDIRGADGGNGAAAQQWTCLGNTQLNQRWTLVTT
ncbi:RICIN domain-containing protein [Actinosynnema sp. NPDC047251]|uniref:Ricin B lectin domain-containing protein n=1 Tax=Saccharothrix espanaensis (strain ATCC 51144 / DSM 44229 / JCM 9112 / NBRC 15066 / NRRL 15764) TaxID=1179773 RepID=K0K2W4_SACES|nr:RICIN domain-containing protein [Saccharothrix espanaensis]CCH30913.1 hypothetical protein BN6_36180 [Saccharothrix espanaensis DSM 44229]